MKHEIRFHVEQFHSQKVHWTFCWGAENRSPSQQYFVRELQNIVLRDPDARIVLPTVWAIYSLFSIPATHKVKCPRKT